MKFNHLNRLDNFWYLPTYTSLTFFSSETGERVASWYANIGLAYKDWHFETYINNLPRGSGYLDIFNEWKTLVVRNLNEEEEYGYIGP